MHCIWKEYDHSLSYTRLSRHKIARKVLRNETARQITAQKFEHARNVLHSVIPVIRDNDTELFNAIEQYSNRVQYHLSNLINTMTNYSVFSLTYEVINLLGDNHLYYIDSWDYLKLEIDRDTSLNEIVIETQIGTPQGANYWTDLNVIYNSMILRLEECNSTECISDVLDDIEEYLLEAVQFLRHVNSSIVFIQTAYYGLQEKLGRFNHVS